MDTVTSKNQGLKAKIDRFFREAHSPGPALSELHTEGTKAIIHTEIPGAKWEEWKYTRLKPLFNLEYKHPAIAAPKEIDPYLIPGLEADLMVFFNGTFQPALSSITQIEDGIRITPLSELQETQLPHPFAGNILASDKNIFSALNAAYNSEGCFVHIGKGVELQRPVFLLHLSNSEGDAIAFQHRNFFYIEAGAKAQIIESTVGIGEGDRFRNAVTEVFVGDNAGFELVKLQNESDAAQQIDQTVASIHRDSNFSIYTLSFSGKLLRNNLKVNMLGENGSAELLGLSMLDGLEHVDNHTQVDHAVAHCYSNELYKGILKDKSTSVFNGRIHVYPDAQKTNAFQSNRNILLSDTANIFTKPQLEIYADDVKCSHGATTGKLDESALFYFMARGIPRELAQKMLVKAFAAEVLDDMDEGVLKTYLINLIEERF